MIFIIKSVEKKDWQGKEYRQVTGEDGTVINVKKGQEGYLMAKWPDLDNGVGLAIDVSIGQYQGKDYVKDFKFVKDELAQKVDVTKPVPVKEIRVDKKPDVGNGKNRSFALAYAKDYHSARIRAGIVKDVTEAHIIATAILFESYLDKGGSNVK